MNILDYEMVRIFYNNHVDCWSSDLFSQMTTSFIDKYVNRIVKNLTPNDIILNAGSGGKSYKSMAKQFHIDIAEKTLQNVEHAVVGNIIDMPFKDNSFDCVICVGTVINYCEIEKAIKEFNRISKQHALLILEYERSSSGLIPKGIRNTNYTVFYHTYFNEPHKNMLYSDSYVYQLLSDNGYSVVNKKVFNTTIPFFEMFTTEKIAHKLTTLEPFFRNFPIINSYSHNSIMLCKKMY